MNQKQSTPSALLGSKNLQELLRNLDQFLVDEYEIEGLEIFLLDESESRLICEHISLPDEFKSLEKTLLRKEVSVDIKDITTTSLSEGKPCIIDMESENHLSNNYLCRAKVLRSYASVPLIRNKKPYGCLVIYLGDKLITPDMTVKIIKSLEDLHEDIFNKLCMKRLNESAFDSHPSSMRSQGILQLLQTVNHLLPLDELLENILQKISETFGFSISAVALNNNGSLILQKLVCSDERYRKQSNSYLQWRVQNQWEVKPENGAMGAVCYYNNHLYINDTMKIMHLPMAKNDKMALEQLETPRTMLAIPIIQNDKPIGVMFFYKLDDVVDIHDDEIGILRALGAMIGSAIHNCNLYSQIESQNKLIKQLNTQLSKQLDITTEMARRDRLTKLYNFGFFQEELIRRTEESRRNLDNPLSLIICDLDHFKVINDTYGHLAGNRILENIADILKGCVREMDIVCRYGGEEFVVILPHCDCNDAIQIAGRARELIESTSTFIEDGKISCTASFGCSQFDPKESMDQFVKRTDQALYNAKEEGRNQVQSLP